MTSNGRSSRASATGQRETSSRRFITGESAHSAHFTLCSRDQSGRQVPTIQLHALQQLMLDIGEPVRAFGPTSAALWNADGFELAPPFHLLVPRGRNISRIGHVVHTTQALDPIDCEAAFGLAVTSPTRAVIDLVRVGTDAQVASAVAWLVRSGGANETFLHGRIAALRSKGRHGILRLLDIIAAAELATGCESWLERRTLELIGEAKLPRPLTQQVLTRTDKRMVRVDFRFPGTRLVVEVLGYRWHRSREQMQRDTERMNQLMLAGYRVLQFTYLHVTESPAWVVEQLRLALDPFASLVTQTSH